MSQRGLRRWVAGPVCRLLGAECTGGSGPARPFLYAQDTTHPRALFILYMINPECDYADQPHMRVIDPGRLQGNVTEPRNHFILSCHSMSRS